MDEEETQFQHKFLRLPSSFSLEIEDLTKSKEIEINKKQLEHKCAANEFESNTERTRVYNLLSFLHWKVDERDKAYKHNRTVLELEKNNIVGLCNRVWMQRKDGKLTEANEYLTEVEKLVESNKDLLLQGKAEIAYSYSAFGPRYFAQSVDMYNQLLGEIGDKGIVATDVLLWKLDMGIIYRKYCNTSNILPKQDWKERNIEDFIKKAALLFTEVVRSNCPARWKGRCFASLAELAYSIYTGGRVRRGQGELFPMEFADKDVETLLNLALEACMEDSHVLKVCGKHFKYLQKVDKAEEILRKSLSIRETSYGHHHLAIVLQKKLKSKILKERRCDENNIERSSSSNACARIDTRLCNEESQLGEDIKIPGLNSTKKENNYSHQFRLIRDETGNCKKASENRGVEKVVARTSQDEGCDQQKQLSKRYLRLNTDKSQIPPEQYQTMKKAQVKGSSSVFSIPDSEKEAVKEIMDHLDKAIEFGNEWASLDKGIVFRQVKEPKMAIETFLRTLELRGLSKTMITVSCYEHIGECCRDIAKDEVNPEEKRKWDSDAKKYFRKAIETQAYKASKQLDNLKDAWMAYSTLKDMFQPQERTIGTLKELAALSNMLKLYGETLDFYQKIKEMDEEQLKDPTIICGEIQILLAKSEFEQAAVLLDLQNCTNEKDKINKEFCKLVYLECAFHLANVNKKQDSGQRFQQAFVVDLADHQKGKNSFDLFLLYDEETNTTNNGKTRSAFVLAKKLEDFVSEYPGLSITCNSDKVQPGKWRNEEQIKQMALSNHIVLILDTNEKPSGDLELFVKIAQEIDMQKKSKLSVIIIDGCECPLELTVFRRMYFETKDLQKDDYFIRWVRRFFFNLLCVKENEY